MAPLREKLTPDQFPNGIITSRMMAESSSIIPGNSLQNGRVQLVAGVKQKFLFRPAFRSKPIFSDPRGYKAGDENYGVGVNIHEITKDYFIISTDIDAVVEYHASETASEYTIGTIVT